MDRQKTQLQETGHFDTEGLTLAAAVEIVTDLGIDPVKCVFFRGVLVTAPEIERAVEE